MFDASFREQVGELLARCRYVKDLERLLADETGFYSLWNREAVRLENYYLDPVGDTALLMGVCYELAYQVGMLLTQRFKGDYVFLAADGNCPQFYFEETSNHTFILAFPAAVFSDANAQADWRAGKIHAPVYLIDPSFTLHGCMGQDDCLQDYNVKSVYDFEEIRPAKDRCEVMPFQWFENGYGLTHTLPLGLSRHLIPDMTQESDNQLMVVGFQLKPESDAHPEVLLGSKLPGDSYPVIRKDLQALLPGAHPLKRLLTFLQEELTRQTKVV